MYQKNLSSSIVILDYPKSDQSDEVEINHRSEEEKSLGHERATPEKISLAISNEAEAYLMLTRPNEEKMREKIRRREVTKETIIDFWRTTFSKDIKKLLNFYSTVAEIAQQANDKAEIIMQQRDEKLFLLQMIRDFYGWRGFKNLDTIWVHTEYEELNVLRKEEAKEELSTEEQKILDSYKFRRKDREERIFMWTNEFLDEKYPGFLKNGSHNNGEKNPAPEEKKNSGHLSVRKNQSPDELRRIFTSKLPIVEADLEIANQAYAKLTFANVLDAVERKYDSPLSRAVTTHIRNEIKNFARPNGPFQKTSYVKHKGNAIKFNNENYSSGEVIYLLNDADIRNYKKTVEKPGFPVVEVETGYLLKTDPDLLKCPLMIVGEAKDTKNLAVKLINKNLQNPAAVNDCVRGALCFPKNNQLGSASPAQRLIMLSKAYGALVEFFGSNHSPADTKDGFSDDNGKTNPDSTGKTKRFKTILNPRYAFTHKDLYVTLKNLIEKLLIEKGKEEKDLHPLIKDLQDLIEKELHIRPDSSFYRGLVNTIHQKQALINEVEGADNSKAGQTPEVNILKKEINRAREIKTLFEEILEITNQSGVTPVIIKEKKVKYKGPDDVKFQAEENSFSKGIERATSFEVQAKDTIEDFDHSEYSIGKNNKVGRKLGIIPGEIKNNKQQYRSLTISEYLHGLIDVYLDLENHEFYPADNVGENLKNHIFNILEHPDNKTSIQKKLKDDKEARNKIKQFLKTIDKKNEKAVTIENDLLLKDTMLSKAQNLFSQAISIVTREKSNKAS